MAWFRWIASLLHIGRAKTDVTIRLDSVRQAPAFPEGIRNLHEAMRYLESRAYSFEAVAPETYLVVYDGSVMRLDRHQIYEEAREQYIRERTRVLQSETGSTRFYE